MLTLSDTLIPLVSLKTPSQHYASTVQFLRNFCISCTRKLFYLIIRQSIQETAGNIQQKEARKSHKHKSQSRMQQIHVNTSKFTYKTSFINLVLVKKDQQLLKMYLLKSIIDRKSSSIKSFSWKKHWACSYNTCWKLKNSFIQEQEPQFWIFHAIFFLW